MESDLHAINQCFMCIHIQRHSAALMVNRPLRE